MVLPNLCVVADCFVDIHGQLDGSSLEMLEFVKDSEDASLFLLMLEDNML